MLPSDSQPPTYNPTYHIPVMRGEVVEGLGVSSGRWYVDATLGGGGHSLAILQAGGKVLGIDQDQEALDAAHSRLTSGGFAVAVDSSRMKPRAANGTSDAKLQAVGAKTDAILQKGNFRDLAKIVAESHISVIAGVLLDLGVSSHQLDAAERGFSFNSATLDMRMDGDQPVSAADLVATLPEADLTRLLLELGEERLARRFARAIVAARQEQPITSGQRLSEVVVAASPLSYRHGPIHPATRTFQALRLAVNDELHSLEEVLPVAAELLRPAGRLAVISFHSLEDRIVKHFMLGNHQLKVLAKKPIVANQAEIAINSRSRSAKLRVAEKRSDD